jgi:hypothetical protein
VQAWGGGSEGSASGEAEDPETRRTLFVRFLTNEKRRRELVASCVIIQKQSVGLSLRFLIIKKHKDGVFRIPVSDQRGTPIPLVASRRVRPTVGP